MEYNVKEISSDYDFMIYGVSYIGEPKPNTVMYISKKVEYLLENLYKVRECLVYAEDTIDIPNEMRAQHCIMSVSNPQYEYMELVQKLTLKEREILTKRPYVLYPTGYYIGENVTIGENAYIEPGCLIGHDVIIGKNACILAGAKIKNAVIGDNFVANENAVIGSDGFVVAQDRQGNNVKIASMGKVIIGDNVEIGACNNIVRGSNSDTVIESNVKLDALVHIAHDVHIGRNVEITAGSIIAGFVTIRGGAFIGINSGIKQCLELEQNCYIGMGANVIRNVRQGEVVAGNPAKKIKSND